MAGGAVFDEDFVVIAIASGSSSTFGHIQPLQRARSELWDRGVECLPAPGRDTSPENVKYVELMAQYASMVNGGNEEAQTAAKTALIEGDLDGARLEIAEMEQGANQQRVDARAQNAALTATLQQAGIEPGGVFDQRKKWNQASIKICFLDGALDFQRYVARIARAWS